MTPAIGCTNARMGNLRAVVTIASIAFAAACGDDGGSTVDAPKIIDAAPDAPPDAYVPDAPNYDFSCLNNAAPTTATAMVQISGTAQEVVVQGGTSLAIQPSAGVSIQACKGSPCTGQNNIGTTGPTTTNGMYMSAVATTGGLPLDGYLIATKTAHRTNRIYPASPLTKNEGGVPVLMLSETLIAQLAFVGINQTAGNSMFAVLITDCAATPVPIPGATLSVQQAGTNVGDAPFDVGALDPMGEGLFLVTNVPPGDTTVNATYNGMTFRAHVVAAVADQITTTQVKPGF